MHDLSAIILILFILFQDQDQIFEIYPSLIFFFSTGYLFVKVV